MNTKPPFAVLAIAAAAFSCLAHADDSASYDNGGVLVIPRVDTPEQVGKYRDATFRRVQGGAQNTWVLTGANTLGSPTLGVVPVHRVEVVKTASFPVAVYLRAIADSAHCFSGPAQTALRRVGNRFEVNLSARMSPQPDGSYACLFEIRYFNKTIVLPVHGLSAGTYTYDVNGVTGSFTLDVANRFPDERDLVGPY